MSENRDADPVLAIATSIARGEPVDWSVGDQGTATATTAMLDELRVIDAVSRMSDPIPDTWGELSIAGEVGRGAHGIVYRAIDPSLGMEVALKVIRARAPIERAALVKAQNEARYLAQVNHPNVVRVFWAETIGSEVGIAMELVHGATLREIVHKQGPLGAREATMIGTDICQA